MLKELSLLNSNHDAFLVMIDSAFAFEMPPVSSGWIEAFDVETSTTRVMSRGALRRLAGCRRISEVQVILYSDAPKDEKSREAVSQTRAVLRALRERYPESVYAGAAAELVAPPPVDVPPDEPPLTESELRALASAYRRKAESDPSSSEGREALYKLAVVLDNLGDVDGAVRTWRTYLDRHPGDDRAPEVLYGLGYIHQATYRDTPAARAYYRRILDEFPGTRFANEAEAQIAAMEPDGEAPSPPPPAATIQTPPGEV